MLLDLGLRGGDALLASGPLAGGVIGTGGNGSNGNGSNGNGGGNGNGGIGGNSGGGVGYGNLMSWSSFLMLYASLCGLTAPSLDVPKRPGIIHTLNTYTYKTSYRPTLSIYYINTLC